MHNCSTTYQHSWRETNERATQSYWLWNPEELTFFLRSTALKPLISQSLPTRTCAVSPQIKQLLLQFKQWWAAPYTSKCYNSKQKCKLYQILFRHNSLNTSFWSLPKLLLNSDLLNPGFKILGPSIYYLIQSGFAQSSIKITPQKIPAKTSVKLWVFTVLYIFRGILDLNALKDYYYYYWITSVWNS